MNKTLKLILVLVGIALLAFGVYRLFVPEASISIGSLDISAQDNTNAYISIGVGLVVLIISFVGDKSKK